MKVSRQRQWAVRQMKHGGCKVCGVKAVNSQHCQKHREAHRLQCKAWRIRRAEKLLAMLIKGLTIPLKGNITSPRKKRAATD